MMVWLYTHAPWHAHVNHRSEWRGGEFLPYPGEALDGVLSEGDVLVHEGPARTKVGGRVQLNGGVRWR